MIIIDFIKKCLGIIIEPKKTFMILKKDKKILAILLLVSLAQSTLLLSRYDLFKKYTEDQIEYSFSIYQNRDSEYTLDEGILSEIKEKAPINALKSIVLTEMLCYFLLTLITYVMIVLFKGKGTFKQYLSVIGYSYIPIILSYVLVILLSLITNKLIMDKSLTSINAFVSFDNNPVLKEVLNKFDFFNIWRYILIYIGVNEISGISKEKVKIIVAILFLGNIFIALINGILAGGC